MLCVGIDWSDQALDYCMLREEDRAVLAHGRVRPNYEGMSDLFAALEAHGEPSQIAVAVETTRAVWVQALLDRGYTVYGVNPRMADHYRKSASAAGVKTDRLDARLLGLYLVNHRAQLRALPAEDPQIVALRISCEDRNRLIEEHTAKLNELKAVLKMYDPAVLGLFGVLDSRTSLAFLAEYPTQTAMQALTPRRLQGWLRRNGYTRSSRLPAMVETLRRRTLAVPAHLQQAKAERITYLAKHLSALNDRIEAADRRITEQFEALPEAAWVKSLPGAGPTLAPAILACVGRDPERFADVGEARAFMGTAPVTKESGSSRSVCMRRSCWKFARRTLQHFAEQSLRQSDWARRFYDRYRARGHHYHEALRALAHKWLKIILALQRTGALYDERVFTHSQERYLLNVRLAAT